MRQRSYWIQIRRAQGWIKRTECPTQDSDCRGCQTPVPTKLEKQTVNAMDQVADQERGDKSGNQSDYRISSASFSINPTI